MIRPAASVETLFSAGSIAERVETLAREITAAMGPDVLLVAVLKGSFVFAADLIRALHRAGMRPRIDFMGLSSYGDAAASSGNVVITRDISDDVAGAQLLLVDDILETGRTMAFARKILLARGAAAVRLCVLLEKPGKRARAIEADFVGFTCPDRFVVGYGLDYAHYYRELPYIGCLEA
jgi:hypoxanthine phosphoribosyltransferase